MTSTPAKRLGSATSDRKQLRELIRLLVLESLLAALDGEEGPRKRRRYRRRAKAVRPRRKKRGGGVKMVFQAETGF